jgi:hypothetical protein
MDSNNRFCMVKNYRNKFKVGTNSCLWNQVIRKYAAEV